MTRPAYARLYKPKMPLLWWLHKRTYTLFVLRELSSLSVAWTVAYLLLMVYSAARSPAEYERFLDLSAHPAMIALNVVALAFVLYHAVTFANLTPQAMVVRLPRRMVPRPVRGRQVPPPLLAGSVYFGWLAVTAFLAWLVMR